MHSKDAGLCIMFQRVQHGDAADGGKTTIQLASLDSPACVTWYSLQEADSFPVGHPLHPHQVTPGDSSKGPQPATSSSRSGQKADTSSQPNSSGNGMNGATNEATAVGSKRARPDAAGATAAADAGGTQGVVPEVPQGKKAKRSKGTTAAGPADGQTAAAAADSAAAAVGNGSSSGSIHPVWQLVLCTQQHPDYARLYTFPSWQKGWKRTSRCGRVCGVSVFSA